MCQISCCCWPFCESKSSILILASLARSPIIWGHILDLASSSCNTQAVSGVGPFFSLDKFVAIVNFLARVEIYAHTLDICTSTYSYRHIGRLLLLHMIWSRGRRWQDLVHVWSTLAWRYITPWSRVSIINHLIYPSFVVLIGNLCLCLLL